MPQASEDCAPKDGQGGLDGLETHGSNQHLPVHLISTVANQLDDIVTAQLLPACERVHGVDFKKNEGYSLQLDCVGLQGC